MHLKLRAIFACVAARPWKEENDRYVDHLAAGRLHKPRKLRMARRGNMAGEARDRLPGPLAADPANRHGRPPRRRRHRENRVLLHRFRALPSDALPSN